MKVKPINFTRVSSDKPEVTVPPAHCWSINKVKVRGVWMNPQYPWACLDIQLGNIDLAAYQAANSFPYPMYGPFAISNLGPAVGTSAIPVPPLNTIPWLNHFNTDPWYTNDATTAFYNWVTSIHGTAPAVGDFVELEELGPIFISSDSIDQSFYPGQNEPIEAWCLEYHGIRDGYGPNGWDSTYVLLDSGHSNDVPSVPSNIECQNQLLEYPPEQCGEVGSINPETGGIVFATHQGPEGCLWYEAAPTDVKFITDDNGNQQSIAPGGTPFALLETLDCGYDIVNPIDITFDTPAISGGVNNNSAVFYFPSSLTTPDQGVTWYWNGNLIDLSPGTPVSGLDISGVNVFPTGSTPTIVSVTYFAPNIIYIIFDTTMLGPSQSQPAASITISTISSFISTASGLAITGLEWGIHDRQVNPSTLSHFSGLATNTPVGYKNSLTIDGYSNPSTPPFFHPTLTSRHVAAEEALIYHGPNQLIDPESAKWFLPSMDEFITMITTIGPDASVTWSNPVNQTQAHIDFQNSFNDSTGPTGLSENVYWTSSQDDANSYTNTTGSSTYVGPSPNKVAIAVKLISGGVPQTLFTSRCHPLSARPIRVYKCLPCAEEEPEYNFRDTHNIWIKNSHSGGADSQALTPFVSIYSPGGAGSAKSNGEPGTIGFRDFLFGLTTTDVMGNAPKNPSNPDKPDYNFFTNRFGPGSSQWGDPNGRNSNGFFITIWDNQKNFIGKWHYKTSERIDIKKNKLNWNGYLRDCATHPYPNPNVNCNPSPTYTTYEDDFPDLVWLRMKGVTLIQGSPYLSYTTPLGERPFRYGGNREELARHYFSSASPIPFSDWHHPYMENVFNGWTSSYAYMKIECQETAALGANAFNKLLTGPNTDIDGMHVQCLRNLFKDTYQGYSPPNPNLNPTTGSLLGCGDCSDHNWNNISSQGGGYGWQNANNNLKGNSAYGDVYGINYVDGRRQETGYPSSPYVTQGIGPILAQHPKHWAFIWHAANPPQSASVNHYTNLHDGYNSCYGYRCHFNIGDTGPAGGIIVGVPNMIGNEVVPGGASTNESDWYYEMSPIDLHTQIYEPLTTYEFGVWNSWVPYDNYPMSADSGYVVPPWGVNSPGGNLNQSYSYDTPYTVIGNGIAETTQHQDGLLTLSATGGPFQNVLNGQSAFRLCEEYETYDMYGYKYCDWYLPNIQESWYIMNNAPAGTFNIDSHPDSRRNLYWTSNEYNGDLTHPDAPDWDQLVASTMYEQSNGSFLKGQPNPASDRLNSAYAYNIGEKVIKQGPITLPVTPPGPPPGLNWQPLSGNTKAIYVVGKGTSLGVRAIRRFKCQNACDNSQGGGLPGTLISPTTTITTPIVTPSPAIPPPPTTPTPSEEPPVTPTPSPPSYTGY